MLKAKDKNGFLVYIDDADPDQQYYCQVCDQPVMQKRGEIRIHHFSHYSPHGTHADIVPCCDHWSYDMSDWHMEWQKRFSKDDIEKVLKNNGLKHIADLLIDDIVVEFQHSSISLDDFNDRNEFYTGLGYKVIWVFDVSEDFLKGRIRDGNYDGSYKWAYAKKLFRELDFGKAKATIYFQFGNCDDKDSINLERVIDIDFDASYFKTDFYHGLSIPEFVKMVKDNDPLLFGLPKREPPPQLIDGCNSISEIWNESYSAVIVKNVFNNSVIFINGKNGLISRDYRTGRMVCRYAYLDRFSNHYKAKNQFYLLVDGEKKIWKLIHAFEDKTYENRIKQQQQLEKFQEENNNCDSLKNLLHDNRLFVVVTQNVFTGKRYYLSFADDGSYVKSRFNASEINISLKTIQFNDNKNEEVAKDFDKKVWKIIPLSNLYD